MYPMNSYLILSFDNIDELTQEVNRKWVEGWRPQGGLSIIAGETGLIFLQAVTREEEAITINVTPDRSLPEQGEKGRAATT
jgi:hypothetical protein